MLHGTQYGTTEKKKLKKAQDQNKEVQKKEKHYFSTEEIKEVLRDMFTPQCLIDMPEIPKKENKTKEIVIEKIEDVPIEEIDEMLLVLNIPSSIRTKEGQKTLQNILYPGYNC